MFRGLVRVVPSVALGVVAACATMTVGSHLDPAADFSRYRTYDWGERDALPVGDPRLDNNPFFDSHVRAAVEAELAKKGYQRVASGGDLELHYHASVQQKVDVYRTDQERGYRGYDTQVTEYEEGTLVIDVAVAESKQLIWRGWAQSDIEGVIDNQARMEKRISEVVPKILARFPAR